MLVARQCQQRQQMWRQRESWQWCTMAAVQLEEHRGCGGFTSTVHKCADARAFGCPEAPLYALECGNILVAGGMWEYHIMVAQILSHDYP